MKKLFVILLMFLLISCNQKKTEEFIKIAEMGDFKIYISTPSGAIYVASGSEIIPYMRNGKQKNINEYMEVN